MNALCSSGSNLAELVFFMRNWQYPGEKEITFPPFTCLEADGDPRVEATDQGEIVVFPLKVNTSALSR